MSEKPIIFSTEMVKAILEGRKTQTRRIIKLRKGETIGNISENGKIIEWIICDKYGDEVPIWPYYEGLKLWVKERHKIQDINIIHCGKGIVEYVDGQVLTLHYEPDSVITNNPAKWRPSIFMPHWASRITLEVTNVRVQRLQEISHEDITAEGLGDGYTEIGWNYAFGQLWNKINEKRGYGWATNPWVWAISFRRVQ